MHNNTQVGRLQIRDIAQPLASSGPPKEARPPRLDGVLGCHRLGPLERLSKAALRDSDPSKLRKA
jgi:hypothetical protein